MQFLNETVLCARKTQSLIKHFVAMWVRDCLKVFSKF